MSCWMKSLLMVAALPVCVAATSREAEATDRFDVYVEIASFKSLRDMDPSKGNANDEYFMTVRADIIGEGQRTIYNLEKRGKPKKTLYVGRTLVFRDIREPSRSNRKIYLSADVSERDIVKVGNIFDPKTEERYTNMGVARGTTTIDLFKQADDARSDQASQAITLANRNYRMVIRVRVVEVD